MAKRGRVCLWAGRGLVVAAVLALAGWGMSLKSDRHVARGRWGFGLVRGQVEVVRASEPVKRLGPAWAFGSQMRVAIGPVRWFVPSRMPMNATVGMPNGTVATYSLTGVYVPLVFMGPLLGGSGGALWWVGRRRAVPAGHCMGCGYDLRGLGDGRCPECGREGLVRRVVAWVVGRGRPQHVGAGMRVLGRASLDGGIS